MGRLLEAHQQGDCGLFCTYCAWEDEQEEAERRALEEESVDEDTDEGEDAMTITFTDQGD